MAKKINIIIVIVSIISIALTTVGAILINKLTKPEIYDTPKDAVEMSNDYFTYKVKDNKVYDVVCKSQNIVSVDLSFEFDGYEVISLGEKAFINCKKLSIIDLPISLKRIKKNAFTNCTGLEGIKLPVNLEIIEDYAFSSTTFLTISIYNKVRVMGKGILFGNYHLNEIYCLEEYARESWDKEWNLRTAGLKHQVIYANVK